MKVIGILCLLSANSALAEVELVNVEKSEDSTPLILPWQRMHPHLLLQE
jgi:hypothetical protein